MLFGGRISSTRKSVYTCTLSITLITSYYGAQDTSISSVCADNNVSCNIDFFYCLCIMKGKHGPVLQAPILMTLMSKRINFLKNLQRFYPALLLTHVSCFTPFSFMALIRFSGIPHNPNPPTNSLAPSGISATHSAERS